jgi:hypothetical protein
MDVLLLQRETAKSSALIPDVVVRMCGGGVAMTTGSCAPALPQRSVL